MLDKKEAKSAHANEGSDYYGEKPVSLTDDFDRMNLSQIESLLNRFPTLDLLLAALQEQLTELETAEGTATIHSTVAINEKLQLERNIATVQRWITVQIEWTARTAGHPELIYPSFTDGTEFMWDTWMNDEKDVESIFLLWLAFNAQAQAPAAPVEADVL